MLSACLLGGTVWLFTIQYSAVARDEAHSDRRRVELRDLLADKRQAAADMLKQRDAQALAGIVETADGFADELSHAQLYNPAYSHAQSVAAANNAEARFEELLSEIDGSRQLLDKYPETMRLLSSAMVNLRAACHFYKAYYYAENADGEAAAARLMKQRAKSAKDTLGRVAQAVKAQ
jgi:hypothetical protein